MTSREQGRTGWIPSVCFTGMEAGEEALQVGGLQIAETVEVFRAPASENGRGRMKKTGKKEQNTADCRRHLSTCRFFFWLLFCRLMWKNSRNLKKLAYHDPITGAYNLVRFRQIVEQNIENDKNYSIIALNVHQFKFINEIYGRGAGRPRPALH